MCNWKHEGDKVGVRKQWRDSIVGFNMGCQQQRECYMDCGESGIKKLKNGDNAMVSYYISK